MEAKEMGLSFPQALGAFLAALVGSALGLFLVLPLGLIAAELVVFPLALGVAALLAALAAGWAANWLAAGGTRTQLGQVVAATEAAAAVLAVSLLASATFQQALLGPVGYIGLICALALALAATLATGRLRTAKHRSGEVGLTVGLLLLAVLLVPGVLFVAWLAGLTGA
jgi:hypothetical protein